MAAAAAACVNAADDSGTDRSSQLRAALRRCGADTPWYIEHLDITCDGCETDPIIGTRFKCSVCKDIDLCERCCRYVVAARVLYAREASTHGDGSGSSGHRAIGAQQKAAARDGGRPAWLLEAVPCLDPSHRLVRIVEGPERAVVLPCARDSDALRCFLSTFPPSQARCEDVAWIVADFGAERADGAPYRFPHPSPEQVEALLADWEALLAEWRGTAGAAAAGGTGVSRPSQRPALGSGSAAPAAGAAAESLAAAVAVLAAKHGVLGGKWLAFAGRREVDGAWAAVARALAAGRLGPSAKVAAASPQQRNQVLCCYTHDFLDECDTQRVAAGLRNCLPQLANPRLVYKPDVFTLLGIYPGNRLGLRPTTHELSLAR